MKLPLRRCVKKGAQFVKPRIDRNSRERRGLYASVIIREIRTR